MCVVVCYVVVMALFMPLQHPHYLFASCAFAARLANVWLIFYLFDHKLRWSTIPFHSTVPHTHMDKAHSG